MSERATPREPAVLARPETFSDEPFADALARAETEQRWLLVDVVDATNPASWAAAYTTWRDSDLCTWLEKYAIAIQLDARAHADTARALEVDAASAPMLILFREGKERLRIIGRQSAAELLPKLVQIDIAEDNLAIQRKMLKNPERDMMDRNGLADALLRAGLLEEALGHYDWLWHHMAEVDPEMDGVRVSFMAGKIGELCQRLPTAHARFAQHRDVAAAAASTADRPGLQACIDYVVLNNELGETERTIAWLDGLDPDQRRALPGGLVDLYLVPLLLERDRWADAGTMIRDPLAELDRRQMFASISGGLYGQVGELHRCLVAAGRDRDAAAVREEALRIEDSPAMRNALR